jgi:hypothetical protein
MVKVECPAFVEGEEAEVAVVGIMLDMGDSLAADAVEDCPDDGRLAGGGSSRYANDEDGVVG